jgi:regulator of protease activity HflC (stomatin/prohibitin superfamily)
VIGLTFLSFLFSRYATGMARQAEWRMLHAGAAWLMGITLAGLAVAVTVAVLHYAEASKPEHILAMVLRLLMLVLAAEILLNLVLDFYRPRKPDEEPRPSFDSRLFGLFTEPGGIAKSIADAINYQFGFEVSSTWFYQLLQRAVVPLIGFALATLLLATCLVFVDETETGFVERFGARNRSLDSGLHLKWPWPIETVEEVRTRQLHGLQIGDRDDTGTRGDAHDELLLWTTKHEAEPHLKVLVPAPQLVRFIELEEAAAREGETAQPTPSEGQPQTAAVPVGQLRVALTLQYRIRDAYHWLRVYSDPEAVLKAIAEQAVMRYSSQVEVQSMLTGDRARIESEIAESIREAAAAYDLGVDITFVGLQGVHPPADTAEAFQEVIGAMAMKTASERAARVDAHKRLAETAGSVALARDLAKAIVEMNRIEADPNAGPDDKAKAREKVNQLFLRESEDSDDPVIGGQAAMLISEARQQRWRHENDAHRRWLAFPAATTAEKYAKKVFRMQRYLETLAEATQGIRKYVLATEQGRALVRTYQLNVQDSRDMPLQEAVTSDEVE